jgi:hypothetical protein
VARQPVTPIIFNGSWTRLPGTGRAPWEESFAGSKNGSGCSRLTDSREDAAVNVRMSPEARS